VPQFLVFYIRNMNKTSAALKFEDMYRENEEEFDLYAVVEHIGNSRKDGHYVSHIKSFTGIWHSFDDENVSMTNFERVQKARAYIWIYSKRIKQIKNETGLKDSVQIILD
jgi:ubiquitin C-terminal hydrolase